MNVTRVLKGRSRAMRRALTVSGAAIVLVVGSATAANAAVYTYGSESCRSGEYVVIVAEYSGTGVYYWPEGTRQYSSVHTTMQSESAYTDRRSTTWEVSVTGTLDDDGTYATCEPEL